MYLVSYKPAIDKKPTYQQVMNNDECLAFIRKAILNLNPMDETSADLRAISLLEQVDRGTPKAIENALNGRCIVIQLN